MELHVSYAIIFKDNCVPESEGAKINNGVRLRNVPTDTFRKCSTNWPAMTDFGLVSIITNESAPSIVSWKTYGDLPSHTGTEHSCNYILVSGVDIIILLPEFGIRIFPIQLLASGERKVKARRETVLQVPPATRKLLVSAVRYNHAAMSLGMSAEEDSGRQTNAEVEFIPSTVLSSRVGVDGNLPVAGQELSALEPDPCLDEIEVNEVKGCQMFGVSVAAYIKHIVGARDGRGILLARVIEEHEDAYEERKVIKWPVMHERVFSVDSSLCPYFKQVKAKDFSTIILVNASGHEFIQKQFNQLMLCPYSMGVYAAETTVAIGWFAHRALHPQSLLDSYSPSLPGCISCRSYGGHWMVRSPSPAPSKILSDPNPYLCRILYLPFACTSIPKFTPALGIPNFNIVLKGKKDR
ncbi:uncharacterized protein C8R40DRAFT_1065330 [Lentinula edodes]|uniref:uncharacterized protein n=1 Tax=Lentinula edodes TaxID=5353 RepID=UPI001E8E8B4B|nr:uncharacterized protein C8R40DRAFT_1065330 [Lentinula edodes]KAH7880231.1 hypothetical protein C8R40DRAFT_1065330 [Lentinula edodes]